MPPGGYRYIARERSIELLVSFIAVASVAPGGMFEHDFTDGTNAGPRTNADDGPTAADQLDADTLHPRSTDAAVLYALDGVASLPIAALCQRVDADPAAVDQHCHRLQYAGFVRARSDGSYSITASGERRLRSLLRARRGPTR